MFIHKSLIIEMDIETEVTDIGMSVQELNIGITNLIITMLSIG